MQQKILVLEDDLALSAGLCFELDSAGYLTVAAYNCQKARQLLKGDHFDLALLDVNYGRSCYSVLKCAISLQIICFSELYFPVYPSPSRVVLTR